MTVKKSGPMRMRAHAKGDERARIRPIGMIRSTIRKRSEAPKQGSEGAPDVWLDVNPFAAQGLDGLAAGNDIIVITWLPATATGLVMPPRPCQSEQPWLFDWFMIKFLARETTIPKAQSRPGESIKGGFDDTAARNH
jgi:hypothetical protein